MDPAVADRLLDLNRAFYAGFARQFAHSRSPDQPGWQRLLPFLPASGRLLDVGCGQGRLAQFLVRQGSTLTYVGVDDSPALLAIASAQTASLALDITLAAVDIASAGWQLRLPYSRFNAVAALAVLHHIPGWVRRCELLAQLGSLLAGDGVLVASTWQFMNEARLRRKIVPWRAAGLAPEQVEAGDYLLDWRRGGEGLRYCHLVDASEMIELARQSGLHVRALFHDDGRENNLNLFAVLARTPQTGPA